MTLLALAVVAALVSGCVPGRGTGGDSGTPSGDASTAAATDGEGVDRCVEATQPLTDAIAGSLDAGVEIDNVWTVRSREFDEVYFTSARVVAGDGEEAQIATWSSLAPDGDQLVFSVNDLAREVSGLDDGGEQGFSGADEGVRESQRCARLS